MEESTNGSSLTSWRVQFDSITTFLASLRAKRAVHAPVCRARPGPAAPCLGRLNCLNDSTGAAMAGMSNEAQYSFGIRTPGDLLLKLRREIASWLKNPDSSDAAIHLIITI